MTDEAGAAITRANTRAGFTATTRILMRIRSQEKATSNYRYTRTVAKAFAEADSKKYSVVEFQGDNKRYWDDAFGRDANLSVFALAIPNQESEAKLTDNSLTGAAATGNYVNGTPWFTETTENETVSWSVSTDQSLDTTIPAEDLTFSNNIQPNPNTSPKPNGYDGVYTFDFSADKYTPDLANDISNLTDLGDGVMKFQLKDDGQTTGIGKFNKGHLIFNHALTRLTIHIRKGTGVIDANAFAFNDGGQIQVQNVPVSGTFDIETGKWTTTTPGTITKMATASNKNITENVHNYMAQFVPGYTFVDGVTSTNVMQFTIDDNTYYVTQDMIYDALYATETNRIADYGYSNSGTGQFEMKQGKNYDLTITVGKKEIETITATLVDWVYVEGTMTDGDNSYVTLSLLEAITGKNCKCFDLYRLDAGVNYIYTDQNSTTLPEMYNWNGNYSEAPATLTETTEGTGSTVGIWKTNWYWESNKSFYHFRTIDKGMVIQGTTDNGVNDYINVYSGPINDTWGKGNPLVANNSVAVNDLKYNDYHWGAPMKSAATALTYSLTGSDNELAYGPYIHSAIGSTHSKINIIEQHMMANIHIILHTGKKADGTAVPGGKITLKDGSNKAVRVTLTNFVGNGIVELGRGLVNANGTLISSDIPVPGLAPTYSNNVLSSLITTGSYYKTQSSEEDVTLSYDYRVVPQSLYRGSDAANETNMANFVGLTLVSPDNNQYYMVKKLYEVTASEITSNHGKVEHGVTNDHRQITRWYPGYDYTYHIYLNKKDIEAITCTVVDWVTVTGANKDITLED